MLAVDQIQQFYLYKKRTDSRFAVPTVVDLFIENDDDVDDDDACQRHHTKNHDPQLRHCNRMDLIRMMDQRRVKIGKALNKHRYLAEELNLAIEQLATDRANLMLERHLLAITKERMRMKKELGSSSSGCLRGLIRSKFKGIPPESLSVESLLDVDKNNNAKSSAASTSDIDPSSRNFQANVMLEDRVRKHFPKLRERCRNLANKDEATKLQEDIKLQEEILNYLYMKVEAIIFKKSFKKPTNNKPTSMALVPMSSSSTLSTPKSDDKRRKRKQLQTTSTTSSRLRTNSSIDTRSSGVGSMDNLFRDVIGQIGTESRSTSRSTSTTETFQQVTIEIVDS